MKLVKRLGVAVALIALAVPVIAQIRFPDVPADHERAESIRWAAAEGLFRGYPDGSFKPDRELSENEFRIVIRRLYDRYDAWTRADVAHFLRYGIDGLTGSPAPGTSVPTTAATTTRPTTTTTTTPAPTATRESVTYYAARGAYYSDRAAAHLTENKAWAIVAYRLASAAYRIACGNIGDLGLPFFINPQRLGLDGAIASGFTDNPETAGYVTIGFCEASYAYSYASGAVITPLRFTDHGFGNATHAHELVAIAVEYAEHAVAGLAAYYAQGAPEPPGGRRTPDRVSDGAYTGAAQTAWIAASDATGFAAGRPSYIPPSSWTAPGQSEAEANAAAVEYAVEYSAAAAELAAAAAAHDKHSDAAAYNAGGIQAAAHIADLVGRNSREFAEYGDALAAEPAKFAEYAAPEAALRNAARSDHAEAFEAVAAKFAEYADADAITAIITEIFINHPKHHYDAADIAGTAAWAAVFAAYYDRGETAAAYAASLIAARRGPAGRRRLPRKGGKFGAEDGPVRSRATPLYTGLNGQSIEE